MSTSRSSNERESNSKGTADKMDKSDVTFDSGIMSEATMSSAYLMSDNDIGKYSREDCTENSRKEECIESNTLDSIRLDSGIDIDVTSDRLQDSGNEIDDGNTTCEDRSTCVEIRCEWDSFFQQDADGDTKLHIAVIDGQEDFIRRIVHSISDSRYLDVKNYYSQTALHTSVICNRPSITRLLVLAGAKTGVEDKHGDTPLHLACKINSLQCANALMSPVTAYEQKYVAFRYTPVIDSPVEYLNEYNYDGLTCVHIAVQQHASHILSLLFQYGADVNIRECKSGYTILHEAVKCGNIALVSSILRHEGIDVERKNYERLTPYQLADKYSNVGKLLLEHGALCIAQSDDESDDSDDDCSSEEEDDFNSQPSDSVTLGMANLNENMHAITTTA